MRTASSPSSPKTKHPDPPPPSQGDRYSVCQKILQPGASFGSEPGAMIYMSSEVKMRARFAGLRLFSGEGLAKNKYTNHGAQPGYIGCVPHVRPTSVPRLHRFIPLRR